MIITAARFSGGRDQNSRSSLRDPVKDGVFTITKARGDAEGELSELRGRAARCILPLTLSPGLGNEACAVVTVVRLQAGGARYGGREVLGLGGVAQ